MNLIDRLRELTPSGWRLVVNTPRMKAWREGLDGERVEVIRLNSRGWVVDVKRDGTRENPNMDLNNGPVSRREALILADMYMADGTVVPAFPEGLNGRRQDEWLADEVTDYEFRVVSDEEGNTDT